MSLKGQQKKYELQKKDINALHTKAKQALSQASARGSQQQRQQLLAGAATPGARGRVGTVDEAVSTSQSITAGALERPDPHAAAAARACSRTQSCCVAEVFVCRVTWVRDPAQGKALAQAKRALADAMQACAAPRR